MKIENAIIQSAAVQLERGCFLTMWIQVSLSGGGCQGFGGYVLGATDGAASNHAQQTNIAAEWICQCLKIAGVDSVEKMAGKTIRVDKPDGWGGKIKGIGHIIEDRWFYPERDIKELTESQKTYEREIES